MSGKILDTTSKLPIPFTNLRFNNTTTGAVTDADGNFNFTLPANLKEATLQISFVGYQTQNHAVATLLQKIKTDPLVFYLTPTSHKLSEVRVKGKSKKITIAPIGYNLGKFSPFQHTYLSQEEPYKQTSGQQVGIKIQAKKYPVSVQDFNFCLSGNGNEEVKVGLRFYSLEKNLPAKSLLNKNLVVQIPPHHTGWIKINLEPYALTLHQDFTVGIEWLNDSNKLNQNWLATAAYMPGTQYNYYKKSGTDNWNRLPTTSFGMYVTVAHAK